MAEVTSLILGWETPEPSLHPALRWRLGMEVWKPHPARPRNVPCSPLSPLSELTATGLSSQRRLLPRLQADPELSSYPTEAPSPGAQD